MYCVATKCYKMNLLAFLMDDNFFFSVLASELGTVICFFASVSNQLIYIINTRHIRSRVKKEFDS